MNEFIVIAAYNEEEKIDKVIKDLKKEYKNIIVVDDGSEDKTFDIAKKNKIIALQHVINRGQGAALKTGIDYALSKKADIIVTFDADGQFLVKDIKKVIAPIKKGIVDVVLGSRFLGKAVNIRPLKKFVLKLGVLVVYFLYGIKVTDSQNGFRGLSKKAAKKIKLTCDRMDHAGEFFWEITKNKLKYKEVPVTVIYDSYSLAKGQSWTKSIEIGIKMFIKRFLM
ncbi:glycosyltransferase family 2 protein [archaeon]|jgi:polyprenyl-phospho-N-acetylgalactosaminyl synthase|nr:glycosyltransferase family 2 protein [archaeon]MBT4023096.1 glycosyltransferase family 2 protein [archaeon]MBT4272494.1 glycosyltransferase family 2 protein [archaeon]MBT4460592.1 glycosyltransferase family 2 protein [archaeon]MBT4857818.1 glycosyltransferase family 2 protein [archaeon]